MNKRELTEGKHEMRMRLEECEETLNAIRTGAVDALVIQTSEGERVFTLRSAELPYRLLVESMNEGALTLTHEGVILYSNAQFADMVKAPLEQIIGEQIFSFVLPEDRQQCREFMEKGETNSIRGEIRLRIGDGGPAPAVFSFRPLVLEEITGISLVVTDIAAQKAAEAELRNLRDRLRALATETAKTEERERRRIASYLHDRIGPILSLSQFRLEVLQDAIQMSNHTKDLEEIRNNISQAINETRTLTAELYPPVLYTLGLPAALDWLKEQIGREYDVRISISARNYHRLESGLEGFLFHAVRELMFNAVKHAQATSIAVRVAIEDNTILVAVDDNGKGFDVSMIESIRDLTHGFGLFSIRERLSVLEGNMEIVSHPGEGARITIRMPISEETFAAGTG
jgi:PAS domain S-box-containing protein